MADLTDLGQKKATGMQPDKATQDKRAQKEPDGFFGSTTDMGAKDAKGVGKGE